MSKIKVWTISHKEMGHGYTVDENGFTLLYGEITELFEDDEVEESVAINEEEFYKSLNCMNAGDLLIYGNWEIKCDLMDEEEFKHMPEFAGW